jgi:hypothetical protein
MLGEKEALLLIWTKFCENVAKFWCTVVKITHQDHIYGEIILDKFWGMATAMKFRMCYSPVSCLKTKIRIQTAKI